MDTPPDSKSEDRVPRWLRTAGAWGWSFVGLAIGSYIVLFVAKQLRIVVLGFVFGLVLAAMLAPVSMWLHRHKVPRPLAAFAALLLFIAVLGGLLTGFGFAMAAQVAQLGQAFTAGWNKFVAALAHSPLQLSKGEVQQWVVTQAQSIGQSAGSMVHRLILGTERLLEIVTMLLLTVMFAVFFSMDGDRMFDWVVRRLPEPSQRWTRALGHRCWKTIGGYVRGLSLVALTDALLMGLGLWIIHVPMVLALMLITFLGAFIPFAGPVVATGAGCLVALANAGLVQAALVIVVGIVVQQIEGHLLHPFIMGRVIRLHPAVILGVLAAGAVLAGLPGAFLAVPVAAVIHTVVDHVEEHGLP